ncbi:MAG: UDP-N-acetylmuramoyl-L-alanine--D-glutamate ligase [Clostridiales Family XIII bacterium]|jgi:UDP-N-acetylmuramoylalanine--D-glutamate ligase|nr:UDP-N-acetylmuramoyl-L-alanine--D-glutamate ligase [Clostridiales Family XIII bacterium]
MATGNRHEYKGKNVLIVGLGKSGVAATEYMSSLGANISVCDARDIANEDAQEAGRLRHLGARAFLNGETPPADGWDFVIVSPGVPPNLPFIEAAVAAGARLTGDLELAYELDRGVFIAITGTNGKTTVTALVGEIFREAGIDSAVTGNIGEPVILAALAAGKRRVLVTEVSSFQLETTTRFRPKISALLNITPDHLDRHVNMENYGAIKAKVFANQRRDDCLIFNADDETVVRLTKTCAATLVPFSRTRVLPCGAFVEDGQIVLARGDGETRSLIRVADLRIPGDHNLENALAAAAIAHWGGVDAEAIARTLASFKGVAHRMEYVGEVDGVRFVNDSKGTNPDAAGRAIDASDPNILLIAGGYDKHADFRPFIRRFNGKVSKLLLLGQTAETIRRAAEEEGFHRATICGGMEECVERAFESARPGDTVLLSPACASWDMYRCFEERGEHFKRVVEALRRREDGGRTSKRREE